ncbi:MAG: PhnD/SsuA/transferrin family substrate-binding protein [Thermodesulfovibrio sp.]|nr:PhnD/SsuA/transferrin family substrate-binding protein [Thermodesulfovibrio sp.]
MIIRVIFVVLSFILIKNAFAETIRIVPLPLQKKDVLISQYIPLVEHLKKETNLSFELFYIEEYTQILEDFKRGKIHIAVLSPYIYYRIKREFSNTRVLAHFREKDGSINYKCVIVTHAKGPNSITEIKGPVALPQKLSTCGCFAANIMLRKEGKQIEKMKIKYFKNHNEAVEAVIREEYEVASVRKEIAEKYKGYAIKILKEIEMGPSLSVVVNPSILSENNIEKIRKALISFNPKDKSGDFIGKYGLVEGSEKNFKITKRYEQFINLR